MGLFIHLVSFPLALLAVGILVESRFPQAAFVVGDIDRGQVEYRPVHRLLKFGAYPDQRFLIYL